MSGAAFGFAIDTVQQSSALAYKTAQHGIYQAGGAHFPEKARGVHRGVHRQLGRIARVLDLMGTRDKERMEFRGDPFGSGEEQIDGGSQS